MKLFKFDLPLNGIKVHNLEELRDNFTTEILELHTSGVLLKWLKRRNFMIEADKLSAIAAGNNDVDKLVALCEIFGVNANRQVIEVALSKDHVTPREDPEELEYKKKFEKLSELLDSLKIMRFHSTQNDYNDCLEAIKEGKEDEGYKLVPSEEIYGMSDGMLVWMDPKPYSKEEFEKRAESQEEEEEEIPKTRGSKEVVDEITRTLKRLLEESAPSRALKESVARGLTGVGTREAMDLRERLLEEGVDKNYVAHGLAGVGTREAMDLRERLLEDGVSKSYLTMGLAGVGTREAMDLRERLLEEWENKDNVAMSLAGVGTREAMDLRERLLKKGAGEEDVARGLAGVGTREAMDLRERLLEKGVSKNSIARGLAGVGTREAMDLRERLLEKGVSKDYLIVSLAGVDTREAMDLRERLLEKGASKNCVMPSLAGVGTREAMDLRERFLKEGENKNFVAKSLAGVNTPGGFDFRNKFFGDDPTRMASSFYTDDDLILVSGVICRYGYET